MLIAQVSIQVTESMTGQPVLRAGKDEALVVAVPLDMQEEYVEGVIRRMITECLETAVVQAKAQFAPKES